MKPLLDISDLKVSFTSSTGVVDAVRDFNLTVYPGQSVAIVGESGSGKSTAAMAVLGLLPGTGRVTAGTITFDGRDITHLTPEEYQEIRGSRIGLVPQDPMTNLNPVWRIGTQIREALTAHGLPDGDEVVQELMSAAGLPDPKRRARQYPYEFSGGMRQRALISMGLAAQPSLLIADEPTSALDVTVQKKILDHLEQLTRDTGTALLFITHDLGLAAERAEHLVVMHRGRVVESGPSLDILREPRHPYTQRLVSAAPSVATARLVSSSISRENIDEPLENASEVSGASHSEDPSARSGTALLWARHLVKEFELRGTREKFRAVDDVSLDLYPGRTLALVGESGSGKSTVANILVNLIDPTSGKVFYKETDLSTLSSKELLEMRRHLQVVFQNPFGSLDPMWSIYRCIEEPLVVHKQGSRAEREKRVAELLDVVALPRSVMRRYPNELSGGQRQRVAIARALALRPEIVVLDEAVSALDVLVQDQILRLLEELQRELGLAYLFITHDLAVVRQLADDVAVMQAGRIVEHGEVEQIFTAPHTEYTKTLIASVPGLGLTVAEPRSPSGPR